MAFSFNGNNITAVNWNGNTVSTVNYNGTEVWGSTPPVTIEPFYIENRDASNSITAQLTQGEYAPTVYLEYSFDDETYSTYTQNTSVTIPASGKCYFRCPEGQYNYRFATQHAEIGANIFVASGPFNIGGDITTLITKEGQVTSMQYGNRSYCFSFLFGYQYDSGTQTYTSSNVVDASALVIPLTEYMPEHFLDSMFYHATNLVSAPELPNCQLNPYCYYQMFLGCSSLTKAPSKVYGTYAGTYNCFGMFHSCSALKNAPEFMQTTLGGNYTYSSLFYNCYALENLKCNFTAWNDTNHCTDNWLFGVDPYILKLELPDAIGSNVDATHGIKGIPTNCVVENNATHNLPLTFMVEATPAQQGNYPILKLETHGTVTNVPELQYNRNGTGWVDYTMDSEIWTINAQVGDYIQFRAKTTNSTFSVDGNNGYTFVAVDGKFQVFGNIMSLLDKDMLETSVPDNAFYSLFFGFNGNLGHIRCPATTLGIWCYANLCRGCTDNKFVRVFTEFPALYASERCYQYMYGSCAYLKTIPEYACTSGGNNCFMRTFKDCTSINMENYTIKLTSLPYRACYEMFQNGGTIHNFELKATELGDRCLNNFFASANPQHIKVHFTDWYWNYFATDNWVNSIITDTSDCIFECPTALGTQATIDRGNAKCPTNWTVVNF